MNIHINTNMVALYIAMNVCSLSFEMYYDKHSHTNAVAVYIAVNECM